MIYVPVGGRLGNQLFYYSFARYIQINLKEKHDICFDFSNLIRHGKNYQYDKNGWEDSLQYFQTVPYTTYNKNRVCYRESNILQKLLITELMLKQKLGLNTNLEKYQYMLSRMGLIYCIRTLEGDITNVLNYDFNTKSCNIFIRKVGETSSYCNTIRDVLLKELQPKEDKLYRNYDLYSEIEKSNSVCISVRRGDYFSNPNANVRFGLCGKEYFESATKKIKELVGNPVFFVFSDDIDWCKKNINFVDVPCFYESGDDPIWEKLRLMYSCKHFIISNSTFSWWAQWLGTFPDKIVISPNRWYTDGNSALVEDAFYKIEV